MKDANGRPFNKNVKKWIVVTPAHRMDVWERLAGSELISAGNTNIYKGRFVPIVNYSQTTADNTFYLVNGDKNDQFIFQDRKGVQWFTEDDQKKPFVDFFAKARYNAGYCNPMHIIMGTTT